MHQVNRFLRGWAGYFRYGNSARTFDKIAQHALNRLARFVAKRHKRSSRWGWKAVAYQSPDRLGLINLSGTIVAPRPNRPWRPGRCLPAVKNAGEPCPVVSNGGSVIGRVAHPRARTRPAATSSPAVSAWMPRRLRAFRRW
ncbi:MAG: hypothetical protein JOZ07_07240 [Solirubrobacterales bacterium]|nr:hypothetical protein [Solirubrobacterales bacterium]